MTFELSALNFLIVVLAVWRCVVFIRQDGLIEGTRDRVHTYLMNQQGLVSRKVLYLLQCQWCLSVWFAFFAVCFWTTVNPEFTWFSAVVTWLAVAATASIVDQLSDHL